MDNHVGTHLDAPLHFCQNGTSVTDYPADFWRSQHVSLVQGTPEEIPRLLETVSPDCEVLLLKTGFEKYRGTEKYVFDQPVIPASLAKQMRHALPRLRFFGFDMISLTSLKDREMGRTAHREFLCEHEILLIEDMRLEELKITPNQIVIAPLFVENWDGSPCTVFAYVD